MTSLRQIEANRLNAQRSTGPRSRRGKLNSRRNALQHGLAAETIIGTEEYEAYEAFQSAVVSDIAPQTTLEKAFAARLVSLLWRLRRATLMETGLLRIQREVLREQSGAAVIDSVSTSEKLDHIKCSSPYLLIRHQTLNGGTPLHETEVSARQTNQDNATEIARLFLRLANFDNGILERLSTYEGRLWKRTLETIDALSALKRSRGI